MKRPKNNNPIRVMPATKDAVRKSCAGILTDTEDILTEVKSLIQTVHKVMGPQLKNEFEKPTVTIYTLVQMHGRLIDSYTKLEKVRVEAYEVIAGLTDESADLLDTQKETEDQKKVRKMGEKMLALMTNIQKTGTNE